MSITHLAGGSTVITGDSIDYFRLCTLKSAIGLEMLGLKVRRGPVIWKRVAAEFSISGNKQAVYTRVCQMVQALQPLQEHIVEEGGRRRRFVGMVEVQ